MVGNKIQQTVRKIWRLVPVVMLWSTWRLRNDVVFNGYQPNMAELGETVKVRVGLWVMSNLPSIPYSVHDIVENLNHVMICL